MSKVLLTIEQVRFIWSLGFMSGRVQEASRPKQGVTWEEETPQWENDLTRLASANKPLSKKLKAANKACTGLAPAVAPESNQVSGASQ